MFGSKWLLWGACLATVLLYLPLKAFERPKSVALQSSQLTESSGVALGTRPKPLVWTHNDSGSSAEILAFDISGRYRGTVELPELKAVDWEDICSFQIDGKHYLAVADVGDNNARRPFVSIYVTAEPDPGDEVEPPFRRQQRCTFQIDFTYKGGAVNCEALAYDPTDRSFVLATKERFRCRLFRIDAGNMAAHQTVEAQPLSTLPVPLVTGADISRDGKRLVLCTYGPGCIINRQSMGVPWRVSLGNTTMLDLPARRQGESVCFNADGSAVMLTSELSPAPLWTLPLDAESK